MDPAVERQLVDWFEANPHGVAAVYVFGSTARGTARADSDVDVGVLFRETPRRTFDAQPYNLEGTLERLIGRTVDLVVLNQAPVDLRSRVLRQGRLIVDRDRAARIQFEVRTRNEAFDLEPLLLRYRAPREAR